MSERQKSATDATPDLTVRFGDHLFLSSDSNKINEQHTGAVTMPEYRKQAWRRILLARASAMAELGISFRFLLAPDKQTIYRHLTPPEFKIRTAAHLRDLPFVIDPAPLLRAFAPMVDLYPRTDSHWNHLGAFLAAQSVVISLGLPTLDAALSWQDWAAEGDLGRKMIPPETSTRPIVQYAATSTLIYDNGVGNNGRVRVFAKLGTSGRKPVIGLVYGDSFSYELVEFLKELFDVCVHVHGFSLDIDFVKAIRADHVVCELTERFAFRLPNPVDGRALYLIWAEKLLRGERPVTLRVNPKGLPLSPAAIDTLRRIEVFGGQLYELNEQRRREEGNLLPEQLLQIDGIILEQLRDETMSADVETAERLARLAAAVADRLEMPLSEFPLLALIGTFKFDAHASILKSMLFEPDSVRLRAEVVVPAGLRRLVVRRLIRGKEIAAAITCVRLWIGRRGQPPTPQLDLIAFQLLQSQRVRPHRHTRKALLRRLAAHWVGDSAGYVMIAEALLADGDRAGASALLDRYVDDLDWDESRHATRERLLSNAAISPGLGEETVDLHL